MGKSLYRYSPFRLSLRATFLNSSRLFLVPGSFAFFLLGLIACTSEKVGNSLDSTQENLIAPIQAVAALGQLTPSGDILRLAAPINGFGGTPRITKLLVEEGDKVERGQVLAVFDNRPRVIADLDLFKARKNTLKKKIKSQIFEVERYTNATEKGIVTIVELEQKKLDLISLEGSLDETIAEISGLKNDLINSQLHSPINGVILRIISREGERPGVNGVLEVGASERMEAIIEVYESDISRISFYQQVDLVSENGGFQGTLKGKVVNISPQVRQRNVLSTDPTGDADARIVEVRVKLDKSSSLLVNKLTGMKVIARFISK